MKRLEGVEGAAVVRAACSLPAHGIVLAPFSSCFLLLRSPEQLANTPSASSRNSRVEMWGLACTMLHMVTGVMPWRGLEPVELQQKVGGGRKEGRGGGGTGDNAVLLPFFRMLSHLRPLKPPLLYNPWLFSRRWW